MFLYVSLKTSHVLLYVCECVFLLIFSCMCTVVWHAKITQGAICTICWIHTSYLATCCWPFIIRTISWNSFVWFASLSRRILCICTNKHYRQQANIINVINIYFFCEVPSRVIVAVHYSLSLNPTVVNPTVMCVFCFFLKPLSAFSVHTPWGFIFCTYKESPPSKKYKTINTIKNGIENHMFQTIRL